MASLVIVGRSRREGALVGGEAALRELFLGWDRATGEPADIEAGSNLRRCEKRNASVSKASGEAGPAGCDPRLEMASQGPGAGAPPRRQDGLTNSGS